jgi:hypothetical protein
MLREIKKRTHKWKRKTTVIISSTWNNMCKSLVCVCVCVCVSLFCYEQRDTPVTSNQHRTSCRRTDTWNRYSPTWGSPDPVLLRFTLPLFWKLRYNMTDTDLTFIPNGSFPTSTYTVQRNGELFRPYLQPNCASLTSVGTKVCCRANAVRLNTFFLFYRFSPNNPLLTLCKFRDLSHVRAAINSLNSFI